MIDLSGKTALVTGGTRGIGKAIVELLAQRGANVVFTYRSSSETAQAFQQDLEQRGTATMSIQGDAADTKHAEEAVNATVEKFGAVDILVCNAGITRDTLLIRMKEEDWDAVIETNLKSVFGFCKAVYRPMMKQRSGSIITISSVVGVMGNAGQANYAASKAGVIGFTKSLARELAPRGVRANVVAPGYIATDMTAAMGDKAQEAMQGQIPLGRIGNPQDIAATVAFLSSDESAYITGQVLNVDGGLAM
ncbi:3-oxoacyl-[acyl-carrier-protein] reductase [soil metagenome]